MNVSVTGSQSIRVSLASGDPRMSVLDARMDVVEALDVVGHAAGSTAVHGIADTSLLETTAGAQAKADAVVPVPSAAGQQLVSTGTDLGDHVWQTKPVVDVRDHGALGDGVTDDTAAFQSALAAINTKGGTLYVPTGVYLLPNGITESIRGLKIIGESRGFFDPDLTKMATYGTVLKSTGTNFVWNHVNAAAGSNGNEYTGFWAEGLTFVGTSTTAGGLRLENTSYAKIIACTALGHTTGIGFLLARDVSGTRGDDIDRALVDSCLTADCLHGFDSAAAGTFRNLAYTCTSGGGIRYQGVGFKARRVGTQVFSGLFERALHGLQATGAEIKVFGGRYEECVNGIRLEYSSGGASRCALFAPTITSTQVGDGVHVSATNSHDLLLLTDVEGLTDLGTSTIVVRQGGTTSSSLLFAIRTILRTYGDGGVKIAGDRNPLLDLEGTALPFRAMLKTASTAASVAQLSKALADGSNSRRWNFGIDEAGSGFEIGHLYVRPSDRDGSFQVRERTSGNPVLNVGTTAGGKVGFFGKAPVARPSLTYSRAGETAAAAQLRAALVALGLVTDSTTA